MLSLVLGLVLVTLGGVPGAGATAATPGGYWLVGADGTVYEFAGAGLLGSAVRPATAPAMIGMAATPGGDGYWLASTLSNLLPHQPMIAVITCRPGLAERSRMAGINHHFEKPLDIGALITVIDAHARRKG